MLSQCVCVLHIKFKRACSPFGPREMCVIIALTLGHRRYHLTDVPPQPNFPPDYVFRAHHLPPVVTLIPTLAVMRALL